VSRKGVGQKQEMEDNHTRGASGPHDGLTYEKAVPADQPDLPGVAPEDRRSRLAGVIGLGDDLRAAVRSGRRSAPRASHRAFF
jgi:hypothetical protein